MSLPSTHCVIGLTVRIARPIVAHDGEADPEVYNAELLSLAKEGKNKWFTAPWLYAEWVASLSCAYPIATNHYTDAICASYQC